LIEKLILTCFCLQKYHHNRRGFEYCANVASEVDAIVVINADRRSFKQKGLDNLAAARKILFQSE